MAVTLHRALGLPGRARGIQDRSRVAPELLGHLALQDGSAHAIDAFAEDLDALWETMTRSSIPPTEMAKAIVIRMQPGCSRLVRVHPSLNVPVSSL